MRGQEGCYGRDTERDLLRLRRSPACCLNESFASDAGSPFMKRPPMIDRRSAKQFITFEHA